MAVSMESPVCLIDNGPDGRMCVQQGALQILEQIQQPVVVVAVVGLYRTGKSYLMNRLAGKHTGFALGSTIESKTKGIWMWCVPHPSKPGNTLVLLDTEGLGDVDKGDSKHDTQIFSLAVLLSSTLVYNSRGTIDNKAVEELQYVTELAEYIKVRTSDEEGDDSEFVKFFPNFIWAVRDFTLERKIDGKDATEDEYLDFALKLKPGNSKKVNDYNLPRECIRKYFPSRKCFTFPFPTRPEDVIRLESLSQSELAPEFLEVTEQFCIFVFNQSLVKQLKDGHSVDGRILGRLAKIYVEIFSSGGVPCLENAVVAMAQIENEAALKEGVAVYEGGMQRLAATFPVTQHDITAEHQSLNSQAVQAFIRRSFKDEDGTYMKSLEGTIDKLFSRFLHQNEEASVQTCKDLLMHLSATLRERLQQGFYTKAGGYKLYCQDLEDIVKKYKSQAHRGVKGEDVLEEFLKQRKEESSAVLQADQSLSAMDKQMCEERERAVLLQQEVKAHEERQRQLEQRMQAERESSEERVRLALQQMEEEMEAQREEARRATESQLREQAALLERGFQEKADKMQLEIKECQRKAKEAQDAWGQEFARIMEQQDRRHNEMMSMMRQQNEALMRQQPVVVGGGGSDCCIL